MHPGRTLASCHKGLDILHRRGGIGFIYMGPVCTRENECRLVTSPPPQDGNLRSHAPVLTKICIVPDTILSNGCLPQIVTDTGTKMVNK